MCFFFPSSSFFSSFKYSKTLWELEVPAPFGRGVPAPFAGGGRREAQRRSGRRVPAPFGEDDPSTDRRREAGSPVPFGEARVLAPF